MRYWFTSDYHFGHENIIDWSNRPFNSLDEMHETIIKRHNERVDPEDVVFFLGDFCFSNNGNGKLGEGTTIKAPEYLKKLNGKFIFIEGNHDKGNGLRTCIKGIFIKLGGEEIWLTHQPSHSSEMFRLNLVGHVHEKWKRKLMDKYVMVNVCVDVWDYRPVEIQDILKYVKDELAELPKGL